MPDLVLLLYLQVFHVRPCWLPRLRSRAGALLCVVALHKAAAGPLSFLAEVGVEGEAMPDLNLLLYLQVVCCKAMLAALFAVKSRCSIMSWPYMKQMQGLQFVEEMGVKARQCQTLFSSLSNSCLARPF